jgi:hypothetical protein
MLLVCACAGFERPHDAVDRIDPLVRHVPDEAEASIESLAAFVRANEPTPLSRMKALHDWVADHVRYDVEALHLPHIPDADADAETVFRERKGVCAGYAALLVALGRAAGLDVRVVTNDSHAWNAVEIDGHEYSIDATWDAGFVDEIGFHKHYTTKYFLRGDHAPSARELIEASIRELEPRLWQIWDGPEPAAERRALLFAMWDDAAEPDDVERGWAGERARLVIEAWVRKNLPEGSPDAFTAAEIEDFNHERHGRQFTPYL